MPTYNAACTDEKCNHQMEYSAPITHTNDDIPACPKCNATMRKAFIANEGGFQLKGTGWYKRGSFTGTSKK